jgi:hypothetical protein
MAKADSSPTQKLNFNVFQTFRAQFKDYMAGHFTNERKVRAGEPMYAGYAFGTRYLEIGGQRSEKASASETKVILSDYDNPGVKFNFYVGEGDIPTINNNGTQAIIVNSPYSTEDFPNGQRIVAPGGFINLPPLGGSHYGVDLPNKDGSLTRLVFQNQRETNTGETITQIVQLPTPVNPTKS